MRTFSLNFSLKKTVPGLKKIFSVTLLYIAILSFLLVPVSSYNVRPAMADWVDDWLNTAVVQEPTTVNSDVRNFYGFGGVNLRWKTGGTIHPISVQLPSISIGCGGIDAFWGSLSLLDFDYLVQRLRNILAAAPAFAFDYALNKLNPAAKNVLDKLNAAVDALNSISINECQASRQIAAFLVNGITEGEWRNWKATVEKVTGVNDNFWKSIEGFFGSLSSLTKAEKKMEDKDFQKSYDQCPPTIKDIINIANRRQTKRYYVLDYLHDRLGVDNFIVKLTRALVGDIVINVSNLQVYYEEPHKCYTSSNGTVIDSFLSGGLKLARIDPISGDITCENYGNGKTVIQFVQNALEDYLSKLEYHRTPTGDSLYVISSVSQYPVYQYIRYAYSTGIPANAVVAVDSSLVKCTAYWFAYNLLMNAFHIAVLMNRAASELDAACTRVEDKKRCKLCDNNLLSTKIHVQTQLWTQALLKEMDRLNELYTNKYKTYCENVPKMRQIIASIDNYVKSKMFLGRMYLIRP